MPSKVAFAAAIALGLGLPAAAHALTLPGGAVSPPQSFIPVQLQGGKNGGSVPALRRQLEDALQDLDDAKKSGRGVAAAQRRVDALQKALSAAVGNAPDRRNGGSLGVAKDRDNNKNKKKAKDRDKDNDKNKKKADDNDKNKNKNKKKAQDRDNDNKKKAGDGDRDSDRKKANRDNDKDNDKNQKKADDRNRGNDRKKADDRDRDNDRKKAQDRNRDDNRRARRGGGDRDRDGVREGNKTSAKELSRKRIDEGQEAVIDGGDRVLRREGGRVVVRSDDRDRFNEGRRRDERLDGGRTRIVIERPDGSQVITVRDSNGDIVRRVRRTRDGRMIVLINEDESRRGDRNRRGDSRNRHRDDYRGRDRDRDFRVELGPLRITIPRNRYIVEQRHASRRDLEEALMAPPVQPLRGYYSLEDVRRSERLRDMMRRIDVSSITFETDSAAISRSEIDTLEELGYVLRSIIDRHPDEVFLIEGHTDAVGSEVYNLALSDRRAESVAIALSDYYGVPPENLITQGYGEYYLKIPTPYEERENRRVTVRRITPLIRTTQR